MLHVILYQPEIPPNTGSIIRLCANTGASLHLVHPLGFTLDEPRMKRAGLDYHEYTRVQEHRNLSACLDQVGASRVYALSTRGQTRYDQVRYSDNDALLFGPETRGLPQSLLDELPREHRLFIPMRPGNRSMNLANAVSVVVYEAWRQLGYD
ncbi:MAG: tRNA (cytidine(34)-2'-O)-methyltransferase [Gammaproteobacteria bacterium]|nr:tRNA (cytidine(34)-2'-O)-methyltransferase [Gammaproteobacteria bacterium]